MTLISPTPPYFTDYDQATEAVVALEAHRVVYANALAKAYLGAEALLGTAWHYWMPTARSTAFLLALKRGLLRQKQGAWLQVYFHCEPTPEGFLLLRFEPMTHIPPAIQQQIQKADVAQHPVFGIRYGVIQYLNEAALKLLCYSHELEIMGCAWREIVHPQGRSMTQLHLEALQNYPENAETTPQHIALIGKTQVLVHASYQAASVLTPLQRWVFVSCQDLSEQLEQLQEAPPPLHYLHQHAPIGILHVAQGYIKSSNPYFDQLIFPLPGTGQLFLDLLCPESQQNLLQHCQEIKQTGQAIPVHLARLCLPQGDVKYVELSGVCLEMQEEHLSEALIFMRDVSQRHASEQNLSRFRKVMDNIGEMLLVIDGETGRILDANATACQVLGYLHEELLDQPIGLIEVSYPIQSPEQWQQEVAHIKRLNNFIWVVDGIHRRKDDSRLPTEISLKHEKFNDQDLIIMVSRDVSERHESEAKLNRTLQSLKSRNFELDNFVYKVSHDLRAPLASIIGLLELAREENEQPGIAQYLKMITESAQNLDKFIRTILAYSQSLNKKLHYQTIDFAELVQRVVNDLQYLPYATRIRVELIEDPQSLPLYSDVFRLEIALRSVIANSIQYQDFNKNESHIRIQLRVHSEQAHITITDNGLGIDPAHLPKVTDMFYRGNERSKGAGLGLYLSGVALEKLGGTLHIESKLFEGTRVSVYLPNHASGGI
ncbi:ATP-binding protein [Eisenibacter elegans]|uniref:sensor histidine kinase n=1 Tax=Eisenibacter elegans TaxID=997 RepID=UPI00040E8B41|nr:ATP-binding protein [Eisenibacter elegans]